MCDNDWVEAYNDHGTVDARCRQRASSETLLRLPLPERTVGVPFSPQRGNRRAGGHNSPTRARLKPLLMMGGYGQWTYGFNYWGPTGINRDSYVLVRKLPGAPQY